MDFKRINRILLDERIAKIEINSRVFGLFWTR
jgi:hypothetical protein